MSRRVIIEVTEPQAREIAAALIRMIEVQPRSRRQRFAVWSRALKSVQKVLGK